MKKYSELSKVELEELLKGLNKEYKDIQNQNLSLNMARGKPEVGQLALSMGLLDVLNSEFDLNSKADYFNYGILDGTPECKALFADLLEVDPSNIIVFGNSSLTIMFDTVSRGYTHGYLGSTPWCKLDKVKFLCPVPGYDRHFAITERFGIEMINIPMDENGPDMDLVEQYVNNDESVKGIWCVPQYANPTGITYSDEVVKRFAHLKPAAKDFRLFWDNAYIAHHLYKDDQNHVANIMTLAKEAGNEDIVFEFASTSKITFPGAGVAVLATSEANKKDLLKHMTIQSIGHDKLNQLRHVMYFSNGNTIANHMAKQGDILRPKFEAVLKVFQEELGELAIGTWTKPKGGYFISFDGLEGTAKDIVKMCKEAGAVLTGAGAPFPYGKDPKDSNIRIAPSFPEMDELMMAAKLFTLCVKIVSAKKYLEA